MLDSCGHPVADAGLRGRLGRAGREQTNSCVGGGCCVWIARRWVCQQSNPPSVDICRGDRMRRCVLVFPWLAPPSPSHIPAHRVAQLPSTMPAGRGRGGGGLGRDGMGDGIQFQYDKPCARAAVSQCIMGGPRISHPISSQLISLLQGASKQANR